MRVIRQISKHAEESLSQTSGVHTSSCKPTKVCNENETKKEINDTHNNFIKHNNYMKN